ncbi:hypothetical protein AKJ09_00479 [Labilithrix luteola]|uniref:Uncharacterized protein n=1 Tax=Labilithrix luteola TaxID=1391654 RepID=A0A0K1PJW9_9BACT|nr:hypothetical protein AKJ09_00479 [Labilithrix luteola]
MQIEDQAIRLRTMVGIEESLRRPKCRYPKPGRLEQVLDRTNDRCIVVDDPDKSDV